MSVKNRWMRPKKNGVYGAYFFSIQNFPIWLHNLIKGIPLVPISLQGKIRFEAFITVKDLHADIRFTYDDVFVYQ